MGCDDQIDGCGPYCGKIAGIGLQMGDCQAFSGCPGAGNAAEPFTAIDAGDARTPAAQFARVAAFAAAEIENILAGHVAQQGEQARHEVVVAVVVGVSVGDPVVGNLVPGSG